MITSFEAMEKHLTPRAPKKGECNGRGLVTEVKTGWTTTYRCKGCPACEDNKGGKS